MKNTGSRSLKILFIVFSALLVTAGVAYDLELMKLFLAAMAGTLVTAALMVHAYRKGDKER